MPLLEGWVWQKNEVAGKYKSLLVFSFWRSTVYSKILGWVGRDLAVK